MPKHSIRDEMLVRRRHLAAAACLSFSLAAQERLAATPEFVAAAVVALYSPIRNEVFTEELFAVAHHSGKCVTYPRVRGDLLEFAEVTERQELVPGAYGILEPSGPRVITPGEIDLIVAPGVAFDGFGYRLGYGKGYYDRYLHGGRAQGRLAGLCFDFQLVERLPVEVHDVRMDLVVTEERTLHIDGRMAPDISTQPNINS